MKKISRFCLFSLSLVLICGLCACAPDIEKPESEVSFSSSGLQSSGTTSPQEENSLSSLPESTPFDPESSLFPQAEALTYHIVNLVFTRDHIENAQPLRDGDIFRFMISLLVQNENSLSAFYPDCVSVDESGRATFPLEAVQQMVSDVFGESGWFVEDPSYDAQQNAYCMDTGFGLSSVYSYEGLSLSWDAAENTVIADFSLIDTPAFPGEGDYGTYRITYRALTEDGRTFLRYDGVQKTDDE